MKKIIPLGHHVSLYLLRKAPMVFSFFFSSHFIMFLFFSHKMPQKKRVKIIITALEYEKKEEVISTTELIRDRKIAIILVLIKLHYFLDHHEIIFPGIAIPCKTH